MCCSFFLIKLLAFRPSTQLLSCKICKISNIYLEEHLQTTASSNTNLPYFFDQKLPAQKYPTSPDIASQISAIYAAHRASIASESSAKLN